MKMIDMRQFSILVVVTIRLFFCYAATSTELVEEWGCYDSEFKLTCNHIDSTVAILEATFTPNCVGSNGKSNKLCLLLIQNYDEGQNSIMKIIAQSLGNKLEQEEELAARKLLEVLRNARLKEQEQEENEARTSEYRSEMFNTTDIYDVATYNDSESGSADYEMTTRNDKKSLRNSLEKLISLYLTKLREDSIEVNIDENENSSRERRELSGKITRRRKLSPGSCKTMRRRIGTLDHSEIEQSLRNFTSTEFNIRKLLNYRCSGKNHCSFIFSSDHPYAMFWEQGVVHIKYICMDDFRLNKYCGEYLNIGNEVAQKVPRIANSEDDESGEQLNEPVAEARVHMEQNFHQFTNLKIIKAEKNDSQQATSPRAKNTDMRKLKVLEKEKPPRNKIYSQDYKTLKILPNELPQDPDIEKVKKEEYVFKNNDEMITPIDVSIETNEIDTVMPTDSMAKGNASEPFMEIISTIVEPTSNIDSNEIGKNPNDDSTGSTEGVPIMIIERKDLAKTVTNQTPLDINGTDDKSELRAINEDVTVFSTNEIDERRDKENFMNLSNGGVLEGSIFETFHFDGDKSDSDESDEDYETEIVKPRPTEYSSRQRTMPSSILLHGFITNPGYPSFYIGKTSDCKWKLKLNEGQSIALTILDLHLRIDDFCKDSLEIVDVDSKKTLYRGCSELSRPIQVQSLSSNVEIILKTKSRSIYPKRGFLIHYKAVGCILPPTPSRVILDYRVENLAKFVCQPKHVFPDSSKPVRVLSCVNENWNDTLVNCVEIEAVHTSGPVDLWFNERLRKDNRMASDSDMFGDVLLPIFIVSGLFILNAIVFVVIIRYRKQQRRESIDRELAEL